MMLGAAAAAIGPEWPRSTPPGTYGLYYSSRLGGRGTVGGKTQL